VLEYLRDDLDAVRRAAEDIARPRVLLVLGRQPDGVASLWTAGSGTFLTDLLSIAGGENIAADRGRDYFELSLEALVAAAPGVIVELRPGERIDAPELARTRELWRRAGLVDARVELCTFDGAQIPGPRVGTTARALFSALHPDVPAPAASAAAPWEGQQAVIPSPAPARPAEPGGSTP
jgi:iron complex transport system substrate-binding protein